MWNTWQNRLKSVLIGAAGAAITAGLNYLSIEVQGIDFGAHQLWLFPLVSSVVNDIQKFVTTRLGG